MDTLESGASKSTTFPSDVLKWMKKNANPKMALKLMQISKYFQHREFPYFVVKNICVNETTMRYRTLANQQYEMNSVDKFPSRLWITNELTLQRDGFPISQFIEKIAVCDADVIALIDQEMTLQEFEILTHSKTVEKLTLGGTEIKEIGTEKFASLEQILSYVPNIVQLSTIAKIPSTTSAKKIPLLPKLKGFNFIFITEMFDFDAFSKYMINNQTVYYKISFKPEVFEENKAQIEDVLLKVVNAWQAANFENLIIRCGNDRIDIVNLLDKKC